MAKPIRLARDRFVRRDFEFGGGKLEGGLTPVDAADEAEMFGLKYESIGLNVASGLGSGTLMLGIGARILC